jgi:prepilin-type N-terminal cleavage/methylation domain-containing protein
MINKGFTLVELLIAIAVGSLIMAAVYGAVNMSQRTSSSIEKRVIAQQDVRGALDLMALEIRMASYNQSLNNTIWRDPICPCINASANPTYKGIQAATANSITIEMDINDTGVINTDNNANPNEIITYTYVAGENDLRITRETNCGGASSFIGDTKARADSGHPRVVRVINDLNGNNVYDTGDVPLFRYFRYDNIEIFPGTDPTQIPNIKTIEISIAVETENLDPTTNARKRLVYSTRVIPRNHGVSAHY